MASYHQRLQNEIARRDRALSKVRLGASTGAAIAVERLKQTQRSVRAEIYSGKAFIREQLHLAENLVHREIDHAGETVERQIDLIQDVCSTQLTRGSAAVMNQLTRLKESLNLKKIVREHPWESTFAALVAGMMVVPMFVTKGATPLDEQKVEHRNGVHANGSDAREPLWKSVTHVLLDHLPALIEAIFRTGSKPSVKGTQLSGARDTRQDS